MQPGSLSGSTGLLAGQYPLAIMWPGRPSPGMPTNPFPSQGLGHPICRMGTIIPTTPSSSKPIELKVLWKQRLSENIVQMKTVVIRPRSRVRGKNKQKNDEVSVQGSLLEPLEEKGSRQRAGRTAPTGRWGPGPGSAKNWSFPPGLGFLACTEGGTVPASLPPRASMWLQRKGRVGRVLQTVKCSSHLQANCSSGTGAQLGSGE